MAKRGRKPKGATIDDLGASLRDAIDEAILSDANESCAAIFRRFGLSQRGLLLDTFSRYAGSLRRQKQSEALSRKLLSAPDHLAEPELIAKLRHMVLVDAVQRLNAGDAKLYETMSLLARIQDFDRLAIEKAAAERAIEVHEQKMKAQQTAALDAMKHGTPGMTPELLAEIKSKVLGI